MKILLLGKNGQVGSELVRALAPLGDLVALDRSGLDLSDSQAIRRVICLHQPEAIVNAAAYTAVDKAESEPELAMAVNGTALVVLAEEARQLNALLVHYSTDYVFDGQKTTPYLETDPTCPISVYGQTKLAGEIAVSQQASRFLVFRTSWVYDGRGKNFLNTIKRIGGQRAELGIVNDQFGAPTWSRDIALATVQAMRIYLDHGLPEQFNGIYHLTAQGETTWFGFAETAARHGLFADLATPPILKPIATQDYPTPARRPRYSVLSNDKLFNVFSIRLPDWEQSAIHVVNGFGLPSDKDKINVG